VSRRLFRKSNNNCVQTHVVNPHKQTDGLPELALRRRGRSGVKRVQRMRLNPAPLLSWVLLRCWKELFLRSD
jgi:hypothetical protein